MTCRFEFPPGTPLVSTNAREHWRVKAKKTKHLRELGFALAKSTEAPPTPFEKARITVTYFLPDRRKRDASNVLFESSKACIDGIVSAGGFLPDDNDRIVRKLIFQAARDDKDQFILVKKGQMIIEIDHDGA